MYIDYNGNKYYMDGRAYFRYHIYYYDNEIKQSTYIDDNSIRYRPCFGDLTKSIPSHVSVNGTVEIFYNRFTPQQLADFYTESKKLDSNVGTFLPFDQWRNMFTTLQSSLQSYVTHNSYTDTCFEMVFYEHQSYIFRNAIYITFSNASYMDVLLLLNMYRRLVTVDCIRATLAAFKLYSERWKNSSLINLLLVSDLIQMDTIPYDSLLGLSFLYVRRLTNFFTASKYCNYNMPRSENRHSRYLRSYAGILSNGNFGDCFCDSVNIAALRKRYHLPKDRGYRKLEEFTVTEADAQDILDIKTWYQFLQTLISQNRKELKQQ